MIKNITTNIKSVKEIIRGCKNKSALDLKARSPLIKTGFSTVDCALSGGLRPEELTILAARPGMGRTAFACEIALNNAKAGKNVCIFSFSLSAEELGWRLIAREAKIEPFKLRQPKYLTDEDTYKLRESFNSNDFSNILICDNAFKYEKILEVMKEYTLQYGGSDLIIMDDINCLSNRSRTNKRQSTSTTVYCQIRALAKILDIPIICCDNLPRTIENRKNKRPRLSDITPSAEKETQNVIFLYRDSYYNDGGTENECEVIVAKAHGESDLNKSVRLGWDGQHTAFSEIDCESEDN
ncbi:MAG: DnaB-like helicase C-terminal domain-containing protein [Clostridia bacterium]|nr:DnaB-like helicase C-terminal domain-containing protein [Clostridia bacterium]